MPAPVLSAMPVEAHVAIAQALDQLVSARLSEYRHQLVVIQVLNEPAIYPDIHQKISGFKRFAGIHYPLLPLDLASAWR